MEIIFNVTFMTDSKKFAVVYVRCSTDDQMKGLSPQVQEASCRRHAEKEGYEVLEVITEDGISGFKENRPGMHRLRELVSEARVSAIVALSSDRVFRNTTAHIELRDFLFERGIRVLYVHQMSPENNATSKMTDTFLASVNEFYRNQVSDKVKETLYAKAAAGYYPTVPPPGYINTDDPTAIERFARKIIIPEPVMGPMITELFTLYATGNYNVYDLTDLMNERGLRSKRGCKFGASRVYDLLRNRVYLGEVRWGKSYNKDGKHKPLIDQATFDKVQMVMAGNNHKACRRRKHKWLLSGFLICARHEKRYTAEWHEKKKVAYYHCSNKTGCGKYVEMNEIESAVADKFKDLQFSDEFIQLVISKARSHFVEKRRQYDGRRQSFLNRRTGLENKRKVAEDKLFDRVLTDEEFMRIKTLINSELSVIDEELVSLEATREVDVDVAQEILLLTKDIYAAYKQASHELKRHYLSFFWDKFDVSDGVILKSCSSPFFTELLTAEQLFYSKAETPKAEGTTVFPSGILSSTLLRR